jgi:hypothetical protein
LKKAIRLFNQVQVLAGLFLESSSTAACVAAAMKNKESSK